MSLFTSSLAVSIDASTVYNEYTDLCFIYCVIHLDLGME